MSKSLAWYQAKSGYSGYTSLDDVHYAYVKAKTGLTGNYAINELESYLLATTIAAPQSITSGSLSDRWRAFFVAKTGLAVGTGYDEASNAFYANNTNDFT